MATKKRKKLKRINIHPDAVSILCFLLFLLSSVSIYFQSMTGFLGTYVGGFFFSLFGITAYALPPLVLILVLLIRFKRFKGRLAVTYLFIVGLLFSALVLIGLTGPHEGELKGLLDLTAERGKDHLGSGSVGLFFTYFLNRFIGPIGIWLFTILVVFFFFLHLLQMSLAQFAVRIVSFFHTVQQKMKRKPKEKKPSADRTPRPKEKEVVFSEPKGQPLTIKNFEGKDTQMTIEDLGLPVKESSDDYLFPPIELLRLPKKAGSVDEDALRKDARIIEKTLADFGIESEVVSVQRGPAVTCFELRPPSGVKVSRIANLSDDLALALSAQDIRIEAPIPGKPYVGVEVPNREQEAVSLREMISSRAFQDVKEKLPVALGKNIEGSPIIAQIASMPHLLIAGATGSGKSVCINTIIVSLLYKYSPKDLRMILIDPKMVELSVYNEIPHLLIPVVTDSRKAGKALYMALQEMERRFKLFSQYSVRDISGYREKQSIDQDMENMPFIVVIIDELSDLMMVASKDVEGCITRLAQMARACGIHLIIATQRPSVDVITGTIKANIPSRISFQVSSQIDSRTILDMQGAEKLLGKGDMLYYPGNYPKPKRLQGAFISDKEVADIVHFLKQKHEVTYDHELIEALEEVEKVGPPDSDMEQDALMDEVLEFLSHEDTVSISGLQRRFRIGYARAGRIVDDLEKLGYVSAQDGAKPRDVLKTRASEEE